MPQLDFHHSLVVEALKADGWTVTDDPLHIKYGDTNFYIDLGAEKVIGAEKEGQRIAVEIKGFMNASDMAELEKAIGQSVLYSGILEEMQPERIYYLAIPLRAYHDVFLMPTGQVALRQFPIHLIVYSEQQARIEKWIS